MLKGAIGRRYAGAIFDIARKQGTIDRIKDEDASRREDARNLIDCRGQVAHMFKHIQANND